MNTISYTILYDPDHRQYAINSDDCMTFASDPGVTAYKAYAVDSNNHINKDEAVELVKADLELAGCVITELIP